MFSSCGCTSDLILSLILFLFLVYKKYTAKTNVASHYLLTKSPFVFLQFCKYNVIFKKLFIILPKNAYLGIKEQTATLSNCLFLTWNICLSLSLSLLFHLYVNNAGECIAAVVAQVQAAVQRCNGAAGLYACNLFALVANGNLLVEVDKAVVEVDGEL